MHFRKLNADHLFDGSKISGKEKVLITDDGGLVHDIVDKSEAGVGIEQFKGILVPGFINAHCHLELSHLRGVIDPGTGLVDFVQQVLTRRGASEDEKLEAMRKAEKELYDNGVVAVGDICNNDDSIPVKQQSRIYWHNFIETAGFNDLYAEKRLAETGNILLKFERAGLSSTLSPHAPYSVSQKLFQLLNNKTSNQTVSIHNQECQDENVLYKIKSGGFLRLYKNLGIDIENFTATGKSSVQTWLPWFTNNQSLILVHNTVMDEEDMRFIKSHKGVSEVYFCICINANKYIEQCIPPIDLIRNNFKNILVGTDSYASNKQLSILDEIRTIQHETKYSIPLDEVLRWATLNGASALRIDKTYGSFEKGKKPGVNLINDTNDLRITDQSFVTRIV